MEKSDIEQPIIPTVAAILTAVDGLSARDVSSLAASYRRAGGSFGERAWFQLLNGEFAQYQPPIVELVAETRLLVPASALMIDRSLDDAIERARADPDGRRRWPGTPLSARSVVAIVWTPLVLFAAGVLLLSITPWLAALSFVAMPVSLAAFFVIARLSPSSSARNALQAAALGAYIEHDMEPGLRARLPPASPDVLLRPWREAMERRPRLREAILDRIAIWLFVGGATSLVILVAGLMISAVIAGERVTTPDAMWTSALWISCGAVGGGFVLVAVPRLLRRRRSRRLHRRQHRRPHRAPARPRSQQST